MSDRVPVLVAAAGAAWETDALELLTRAGASVVLHRRCVDLADLLATAATGQAAGAVVSASLPGLDADSVAALQRAAVAVVLVADAEDGRADPARLRRLGAEHVLAVADLGDLRELVASSATPATADPRRPEPVPDAAPGSPCGSVLAVWGPAGAPGRTTVAVGLAAEIAARGRPTLLVDADPYAGAVAQHLGVLDEASGLLAAARLANTGQLDQHRLAALARQVGDLRVLTGLPRADRWLEVREPAFHELLDVATGLAGHVLLDVGFSLEGGPGDPFGVSGPVRNQMTIAAVERADELVVVGGADPVGLARLARGLVELRELVPDTPVRVVVNRFRPTLGWGAKEIHGMVEGFLTPLAVHFLPDDRKAADRALMAGASLVETGDSELRSALAAVADELLGTGVRKRSGRLPGRGRVRRRRAGRAR